MEKFEKAIDDVIEASKLQSKNIDDLADNMAVLVQAVRMRPTKRQTFGWVGVLVSLLLLMNLAMFGVLYNVAQNAADGAGSSKATADAIADCLTPGGKCYNLGQEQQKLNRLVVSLRSEQIRLQDEIKVAEENGQPGAAETRKRLLDDVNRRLVESGQTP